MSRNRIAVGVGALALGLALTVGTAVADDLPGNGCSVPCPSGDVMPNAEVNAPPASPAVTPTGESPAVTPTGESAPAGNTANVLPESETNGNVAPAVATTPPVVAAAAATAGSSGLPVTGGDIAGLTAIGAAAVGSGALLLRRSRRRTA